MRWTCIAIALPDIGHSAALSPKAAAVGSIIDLITGEHVEIVGEFTHLYGVSMACEYTQYKTLRTDGICREND